MGVRYLLDTNTISEQIREKPNKSLIERLAAAEATCAIAAGTWHEIQFGIFRLPQSHQRFLLETFASTIWSTLPILSYDYQSAEWFAQERARLSAIGLTPSYPDGQIAAVAATNNLILVTRNVIDFQHFNGLAIENWHG